MYITRHSLIHRTCLTSLPRHCLFTLSKLIVVIIIHEFHRDASLEQNFRAADVYCQHCKSLRGKNIFKKGWYKLF